MVRRHTAPIPLSVADLWKRRLSVLYAVIAWNALGFVFYQMYKGKSDWASKLISSWILVKGDFKKNYIDWIKNFN